jgi:Domain of Unknown Function (DUF1206)
MARLLPGVSRFTPIHLPFTVALSDAGRFDVCPPIHEEVMGMHTASAPRVIHKARRVSDGPVAHLLARAGLTARGVIYILLGWVTLLVALGHGTNEADQLGALQLLAGKPYGLVSLWLLFIGFAGYALWRLSEAAFGAAGQPDKAGPRLKSLARAVIYAGLSYLTFTVISGTDRSQSRRQQDITATAMQHAGGRLLVGAAGLIIVFCGVALVIEGVRKKFMKYLRTAEMSARTCRVVRLLGTAGSIARGVVFALVGVLVIAAAVTHDASDSGGIDKALLTLRDQPLGGYLVLLAAAGLAIFGLYGLCEARWRKV